MTTKFSDNRLLVYCVKEDCRDRKANIRLLRKFSDLSCNFENGWSKRIDESEGGFNWDIQGYGLTS